MISKDSDSITAEKGYLVHKILRDHFQIEDSRLRKLSYCDDFNKFFFYIYSKEEIAHELSFNFGEIEEMIQLFISVSTHLLKKYGYSPICRNTWKTMGREWKYYRTVDALTLPKSDILLVNNEYPVLGNVPFRHPRVDIPIRNWDFALYYDLARVFF